MLSKKSRYLFRCALGERGDQRAFASLDSRQNLGQEIIYLPLGGSHLDDWVEDPGGPNNQLSHLR
jgi:hypothetical protein